MRGRLNSRAADYDTSVLRAWSSRLGRAGKVPRSAMGRRPKTAQPPPIGFARVVTKAEVAQLSAADDTPAPNGALFVLVGRARRAVAAGFDSVLLRCVVAALAGGAQ